MDKKQTPAMLLKIKSMRENLSKAELLVCDYIIEHPEEVIYLSVSELAAKSGVSDATVIRASQKIGSSSYQDLKISLAQDIVTPLQSVNEEIEAGDPTNVVVEKVFQGILHTLNYTYRLQDGGMLERAADMLLSANRICICGLGNSHAIAEDIQHKLMRLGLNATAYADNHLQVICSSFLKKGDVLFAVSHSGSSRDVVHAAEIALDGGAAVISLTNVGRSPLADISTIALHTASNETRYRRVALSSRIAQMALVDVLYTMIALKSRTPPTASSRSKRNWSIPSIKLMSEITAEKKPCAFSGRAVYNEDAIKAFCRVQYAAFKKKNQLTFILLGIALIVLAVCGVISGTLSIVVGAVGCWVLTLPGVVSKSDADKLIAAMDGSFGTSKYSFDDKGFDIVAGNETNRLGYDNMIRLIEDESCFFFFAAPQLAYIVEKKTLDPHDTEKFKAYTSRRVGLEWTRSRPWYSVNVKGLISDKKNTRKISKH